MMNSIAARACSHPGLRRFAPLLTFAAWYVALGLSLRLVLWWVFGIPQQVGLASLVWILPTGAISDMVESLYLLAPFALFLWLATDRWYRSRAARGALFVGGFVWLFGLTFVAAIEYFFFEEFDARLNLVAVDYLMYPTEVVEDIWTSYPVVPVLLVIGLVTALTLYIQRHRFIADTVPATRFRQRSVAFAGFAALLTASALGLETHGLTHSANRVANEIAANGASSFFRALRTNELDYHTYYASRDPRKNLDALVKQLSPGAGTFTRLKEGRVDRAFPANPLGLGKLNVVVVASESFGAEFSELYGSRLDWTPQSDAYARQGVWFRHMYASGTRTVRGLEAIVTSLPPIPSVSVLRRQGNE